jgi:copper chaperone NosL
MPAPQAATRRHMKRLHPATRLLLLAGLVAMAFAWNQPAWQIRLWAPQYPEGLAMQIWLNDITGDVAVINGLNHYIGMREIEVEAFPEFRLMRRILLAIIAIGLLPVLTGRRPFLWVFVLLLLATAAAGLADFWYWSREFGHNLDPKAAISMPGMTYDPPLIGYKVILNFVAYSAPALGGYLLIGAGTLASSLLAWEIWRTRSKRVANYKSGGVVTLATVMLLPGCDGGPQAIDFGKDACAECNMNIVDKRFGAEFVTGKGKVFKFDDVNCMVEFIEREPHAGDTAARRFVVAFNEGGALVEEDHLVFVKHKNLRTPMRSHVAAFRDKDTAQATLDDLGEGGSFLTWQDIMNAFPAP